MMALLDIKTSQQLSIQAVVGHYGLKYETLRDQKRGAKNHWASYEDQQDLTIDEENTIIE